MPWRETRPVDERKKFVEDYRSRVWSMSELCARFSISRPTGYKWVQRAKEEGWVGLEERSRAPKSCPHRTPPEVEEAIVAAKVAHPLWGPSKILDYLADQQPELALPAVSTAGALLDRHGWVKRRRPHRNWRHPSGPLLRPIAPNEVTTADFKGQFRTTDGHYCYPLTIADPYSRYLLCCQALSSTRTEEAWPVFERVFREVGLPRAIRTDNGSPFSSTGVNGLAPCRSGGFDWAFSTNGSGPVSRKTTPVTRGCTGRSRRPQQDRLPPTPRLSSGASTPSAKSSTR